jgi:predicted Zn-dependent protease
MRLDVVHIAPAQLLVDYLNTGWIENIEPGSVEELSVNGFPAATATAQGNQWAFRLYTIRFGSDVYRFIFAARNRTAETERAFAETVHTFRRLSPAETQSAKPLRLAVVKVARGEGIASLAARMASVDRPLDRFRVLNGLDANEQPKPGDLVKIIVQ